MDLQLLLQEFIEPTEVQKILVAYDGDLRKAYEKSAIELERATGVTKEAAERLVMLNEYSRQIYQAVTFEEIKDRYTPKGMAKYIMSRLNNKETEYMMVFLFDGEYREVGSYIDEEIISMGGAYGADAHPIDVFRKAIRLQATNIVLAHNHPTGSVEPSKNDILTTRRLSQCGDMLGIDILDHFIVGSGQYYSMAEHNQF